MRLEASRLLTYKAAAGLVRPQTASMNASETRTDRLNMRNRAASDLAVLRSGAEDGSLQAVLNYMGYQGGHSHADPGQCGHNSGFSTVVYGDCRHHGDTGPARSYIARPSGAGRSPRRAPGHFIECANRSGRFGFLLRLDAFP